MKQNKEKEKKPIAKTPKKHEGLVTKIVCSSLIAITLGWTVYCGVCLFININDQKNASSYLTLEGKDYNGSKAIYDSFGNENQNKIRDYALVGTKLYLSESKLTPETMKSTSYDSIVGEGNVNFYLADATKTIGYSYNYSSSFEKGCFYFDLSKLEEGDYLIFPVAQTVKEGTQNPFSIAGESLNETVYSLPASNGTRKRITLKNNSVSPYTLINVKNCGSTLPTDVYDFVIMDQQYTSTKDKGSSNEERVAELEKLNFNKETVTYKVKVAKNMKVASEITAHSVFIDSEEAEANITSVYNPKDGYLKNALEEGSLKGYDSNPEIRELTGYLDGAGLAYDDVKYNNVIAKPTDHIGKEAYLLMDSTYEESIQALLA